MPDPYKYTKWSQAVFDTIEGYADMFRRLAASPALDGISAPALAGAMAKEMHMVYAGWQTELFKDIGVLARLNTPKRLWGCSCSSEYKYLEKNGYIDLPLWWLKTLTLKMDVGPANTQLATSIRAIDRYAMQYELSFIDPLQLAPYWGTDQPTCIRLAEDLITDFPRDLLGDEDFAKALELSAKIWGLRMKEAKAWFESKVQGDSRAEQYWSRLPQAVKDALYGHWVIHGEVTMNQRYKLNVATNGFYKPGLGKRESGSWDILGNSIDVGNLFGPDKYGMALSDYATHIGNWENPMYYDPAAPIRDLGSGCNAIFGPAWNAWKGAGGVVELQRSDPLIVDLDGDGTETLSSNWGVFFDNSGDGFVEVTAWVHPNDGLLAMDRNGDGIINDGKELFGDQTILKNGTRAANGFHALAEFDSNKDGKVNANDPAFAALRVWQDLDRDGFSLPEELQTLDELGIAAINLDSTIMNVTDPQGNSKNRVGTFEKADGTIAEIAEYTLNQEPIYSFPTQWIDIPDAIAALPALWGTGTVYDLHQAMVRDASGELKWLVEEFANATGRSSRETLMEQILFKWTGSQSVEAQSRGSNIDARKLAVLEQFFGEPFVGTIGSNPTYAASTLLNESYRLIFEEMYSRLMAQTHLKDLFGKITYTPCSDTQESKEDFSAVIAELQAQLAQDPEQGKLLLSEFARTMRGLGHDRVSCLPCREFFVMQDPDLDWVIDTGGLPVYEHVGQGTRWWSTHMEGTDNADAVRGSLTEGDGCISGLNGNDVIYGTSRVEWLFNDAGDAVLVAGAGNDRIWAGAGNDILDGGEGNDEFFGQAGNDTYIFRRGSGRDTIVDLDATAGNIDSIWLGSNLTPDDVVLRRLGNNLVLKINDTTDTLTVQDFFRNDSTLNRVERIQFMDGTVWTDLDMILRAYSPTEGDDTIYDEMGINTLAGAGGNDTLYGLAGDDTLHGDAGNDIIWAGAGDDILDGGEGNDQLLGEAGNDTYLFRRGQQQLTTVWDRIQ